MAETQTKKAKLLQWALALSVGINLVIVGLVAGAAYRFDGPHGRPGGNMRSYGTAYIMALPEDTRHGIFRELRRDKQDRRLTRAARRGQYDAALEVLRSDPFDPARMQEILDAQRDAALGVQQAAEKAWLTEIAQMDSDARAAYADRLQETLDQGSKRRPGNGKRDRSDRGGAALDQDSQADR